LKDKIDKNKFFEKNHNKNSIKKVKRQIKKNLCGLLIIHGAIDVDEH
jgi:hypothetical protein